MSENLLVLMPDKPAEGKTREARKAIYALCGEASLYALPPVLILGKTEKNGFERKSWHKDITLTSADALMSVFGFVLHEEETVTAIQKELGLEVTPSGLYIAAVPVPLPSNIEIKMKRLRLALLKKTEYGYSLLQ